MSPEGRAAAKRPAAAAPLTSEEARQHAEAEGLTLLKAVNKTRYYGVHLTYPGQPKPYQARVRRSGNLVHLGFFATAEEAALHVARSPEGQAAAKKAAAPLPLTSEEARQQAETEGLTLLKAGNKAGHFGVYLSNPGRSKPYEAKVRRDGKKVCLGSFATAEEAALRVARTQEGQAAAKRPAAAAPLTSEEVQQQAEAEGLTLLVAPDNKAGYFGVSHQPGIPKPYRAQVTRGGKAVGLGNFATAEEAALCFARSRRHKELRGRWEQVLTAVRARSAEEEAEVAAGEVQMEEEAELVEEEVEEQVQEQGREAGAVGEAAAAEVVGGLPGLLRSPSLAGLYVIVGHGAPAKQAAAPPLLTSEEGQDKAVDARNKRHAKLAQARRERELLSQQQQQDDARQEQELREAKRLKVKQESAANRSDGIQVVESIDLTDELPPSRVFAETEDTKACPNCAHAVLIDPDAVACGTAVCLSCGTEFCWRCKKVRADGRHMRCRCS